MNNSSATVADGSSAPTDFTWADSVDRFHRINPAPQEFYGTGMTNVAHTTVGAIVFNTEGKVLLVQRAATRDILPNAWDIPGGTVDMKEETTLHGVVSRLWEGSGLRVVHINHSAGIEGKFRKGKLDSFKYSFVVDVDGYNVKLDPKKYQRLVWATEQEVRDLRCGEVRIGFTTPRQRFVVLRAFKQRKGEADEGQEPELP